jgi:PAS domain S-box-containing protein
MTQRESSSQWPALLDGAAETFAFRFFPGEQQTRSSDYAQPPAQREFTQRIADSTRWVVAILGVIILVTGAFGIGDLLIGRATASWDWRHFLMPVGIATLLVAEAGLIAAVTIQDVRRRELETLLRQSEERMTMAAEAAHLGLWRWDAKTDRFWATTYCREMLGIPAGSIISLASIIDAVHEDDRALVTSALQSAIEGRTAVGVDYRRRADDNQIRWMRARGRFIRDANGNVESFTGTIVDISEEKSMRAELEWQQQSLAHLTRVGLMGELSGALAHELNQPLTAILSNAQALQRMVGRGPVDVAELQSAISDIIDDDSRAGDVIRHLRSLLRKGEPKLEPLDMNAILLKALGLTRSDLTARRVTVVLQFEHRSAPVMGDAVQLLQLVLNLILNAAEAMSGPGQNGGVLRVSSDLIAQGVHFSISDTGPGIETSMLNRLFEPFVTSKTQGLGLGLSISRAITIGHNGSIWAENNPGRGATFHVALPLASTRPS